MDIMKKITFVAYDTLCAISIADSGYEKTLSILNQAKSLALSIQSVLNMYDPTSELSRLCGSYIPGTPVKVSKILYDFIKLNLEFSYQTDSAFDFTVGPLVKIWNFMAEYPEIPTEMELKQAIHKVGYQHVHLCHQQSEVVFDVAGMILDPGASGKGYALHLVADFLKGRGVRQAVLDFGGNLLAIGNKPSAEGKQDFWRVGIRHPDKEGYLGAVCLANRGIATSSWYEHNFKKNGVVYHHLLNSHSGKPQEVDISSVSVLSDNVVYTDLLSTAFFVMGYKAGCVLVEHLKNSKGIDADYVVLKRDGSLLASKGALFLAKQHIIE